MVLRSCAKCSVFVAFRSTMYETKCLFVNPQLAGLHSAGNDDAKNVPKALGSFLGSDSGAMASQKRSIYNQYVMKARSTELSNN